MTNVPPVGYGTECGSERQCRAAKKHARLRCKKPTPEVTAEGKRARYIEPLRERRDALLREDRTARDEPVKSSGPEGYDVSIWRSSFCRKGSPYLTPIKLPAWPPPADPCGRRVRRWPERALLRSLFGGAKLRAVGEDGRRRVSYCLVMSTMKVGGIPSRKCNKEL